MSFHMSVRRKIAISTWSSPKEGNIYGKLTIDATNALRYIDHLRDTLHKKITITHLLGKAVGLAMAACPDVNGRIFLGRYIPHKTTDISFLASLEGGKNLERIKIFDIDKKTTWQIADELRSRVECLRGGQDEEHEKTKPLIESMPTWLIRPVLWLGGYLAGAMGIDVKPLGLKKFPFGCCLITNVGMFGLDEGYAPPIPFARIPVLLAIPEIKKRAVVVDDQITIKPLLDIMATVDHRFMDGHRGSMIAKTLKRYIENPWLLDGLEEPA